MTATLDTAPTPAPVVAPAYRLEVQSFGLWWPAVSGDSPDDDARRSTFATIGLAMKAVDGVLAARPAPVSVRLVAGDRVLFAVQLGEGK
jgi:hypothetical protein